MLSITVHLHVIMRCHLLLYLFSGRLAVYESSDDEQTKSLRSVLQRSALLTAQVTHLQEKISRLEKENIRLEEERSEFEELENDARLRCQRFEMKMFSYLLL